MRLRGVTYQAVAREHLQQGDEIVAISQIFVQVPDVPLGLWEQDRAGHHALSHIGPREKGGATRERGPQKAPTSARQCYPETRKKRKKRKEAGKRGEKTENNRVQR